MSNSIAPLTISTITQIVDYLEGAGVVATAIDPQEILDHVTPAPTLGSITDEERAQFEAEIREARATACEFDGCDGNEHEAALSPSEWTHQVATEKFDGGIVEVILSTNSDGTPAIGYIEFEGCVDMTADELRGTADRYEAFPAWLRGMADRLDEIQPATPLTGYSALVSTEIRREYEARGFGVKDLRTALGSESCTVSHALLLWNGREDYTIPEAVMAGRPIGISLEEWVARVMINVTEVN